MSLQKFEIIIYWVELPQNTGLLEQFITLAINSPLQTSIAI